MSKFKSYIDSLWIKKKILLIVSVFFLVAIVSYSYYNYVQIKDILYKSSCDKLLSGVYAARFALGDSFHDRITGPESISPEEHMENIKKLNTISENLGFTYVYTMILENDTVYFSSSSATSEELKDTSYSPFYQAYAEASNSVHESFKDLKLRYEENTDRWGTFRSIVYPVTTSNGKVYIIGIDIKTSDLEAQFTKILFTNLVFGITLFTVVFIIIFIVVGKIVKPIHQLTQAAMRINEGDLSVSLSVESKDETKILSDALSKMVVNLNSNLEKLSAEKANVERKIELAVKESEESRKYLEYNVENILIEMNKFSEGDLMVKIVPENENDAIGKLSLGLNHVVDNLRNLVINLIQTVQSTTAASNGISLRTEEMTRGAHEQTKQSAEVEHSIEEMTLTILNTTNNALVAANASLKAGDIAKQGDKVVAQTITSMNKIAEVVSRSSATVQALGQSSDQIGEMVKLIDDIADQTNLLALNAAIEAARAGDHGRGFGVVADEVKKLAERTSSATSEIAKMIKGIQVNTLEIILSMQEGTEQVEHGKVLADEAGISLNEIIKGSEEVVDVVTQVAASSKQQSIAIEQIAMNLKSINNVTRQNEGNAQGITSAAGDLKSLTMNLEQIIGMFKLQDSEYDFANN